MDVTSPGTQSTLKQAESEQPLPTAQTSDKTKRSQVPAVNRSMLDEASLLVPETFQRILTFFQTEFNRNWYFYQAVEEFFKLYGAHLGVLYDATPDLVRSNFIYLVRVLNDREHKITSFLTLPTFERWVVENLVPVNNSIPDEAFRFKQDITTDGVFLRYSPPDGARPFKKIGWLVDLGFMAQGPDKDKLRQTKGEIKTNELEDYKTH